MHSSAGCSCTDGIHTQKKQVRVISILRPSFARSPLGGHNLELHSQGGRFYRGIAMYCLQVIVQGCWARRVPFAALVRQRYVQHDSLQSLLLADRSVVSSHSATLKHMPRYPGRREVDHEPSILHGKQQQSSQSCIVLLYVT